MSPASLERLAQLWRGLRRRDVFPVSPLRSVLSFGGLRGALCTNMPLRRLIADHLTYSRLEDAAIPVHIVTTDVLTGDEVLLSRGDTVDAVLASTAIPGVFDPVEVDGRLLWDGGVANNTAVSQAVALRADRVIVLPAGTPCALDHAPRTPLAAALHAISHLIAQRLEADVACFAPHVHLVRVPPLCPLAVHAADFRHGGELIDRARAATQRWLATSAQEVA